jgi:anti-sigma factor RsiW
MIDDLDLQAYFDEELGPQERAEMAYRLDSSPANAQRLRELQVLRSRLQSLPRVSPPGLAERVRLQMSSSPRRPSRGRVGWLLAAAALAAACMLFLGFRGRTLPFLIDQEVRLMVSDHLEPMPERGTMKSPNPQRLEEWLAPQLAFTPKLPRWTWATPISGRLCWIRHRKLARVRYRFRNQEFSLFVFPETHKPVQEVRDLDRYRAIHWTRDGLGYVVVMDRVIADQIPSVEG